MLDVDFRTCFVLFQDSRSRFQVSGSGSGCLGYARGYFQRLRLKEGPRV